jgi:gas vesicle protein
LGILFAPDKGKDTRKLIVRKSREFGTDMNHLMEEKLNELMLSMRGKFTPMKKTTEPVKPENANV